VKCLVWQFKPGLSKFWVSGSHSKTLGRSLWTADRCVARPLTTKGKTNTEEKLLPVGVENYIVGGDGAEL
jgi:hypothetical protein